MKMCSPQLLGRMLQVSPCKFEDLALGTVGGCSEWLTSQQLQACAVFQRFCYDGSGVLHVSIGALSHPAPKSLEAMYDSPKRCEETGRGWKRRAWAYGTQQEKKCGQGYRNGNCGIKKRWLLYSHGMKEKKKTILVFKLACCLSHAQIRLSMRKRLSCCLSMSL